MPFIVAPIAWAVATALPVTASATAAIYAVTQAAIYAAGSFALQAGTNALARSLAPDQSNQAAPLSALNSPQSKVNIRQATPFQRILRSRQRTGGPVALYRIANGDGENSKLIMQHLYSRRKISAVNALNLNGTRVSFGAAANFEQILIPVGIEGQPDYPGHVRACFQAGTLAQPTNPLLRELYPDLPEGWRLPGIGNAVYEYEFGADFEAHTALYGSVPYPNSEPELLGCPVYDPRDPTQWLPRDPSDIHEWFAAQESWKYSANAKLHQADQLWQRDGLNAGPDGVRWDKVAEGADRDDEAAATRDTENTGIFEKRYEIHGVQTMDQRAADVLDGMLTASRSRLVQGFDGTCWPSHDGAKRAVFTITDDMLIGDAVYRGFKSIGEIANRTTMEFVAPDRLYQQSEGPPHIRADLIAADGKEISLNVNLPWTPSPSMAQRIAKADLADVRIEGDDAIAGGATFGCIIDLRGLGLREDDCVALALKSAPHRNGLYVVNDGEMVISVRGQAGIALRLVGYSPAICNDWHPAVDDKPFVLTDTEELLAA